MRPSANNLAHAPSLYLRQHKDNPVHWQNWGEEALARAKSEQRLILVSSGYSVCHWCHVMAKESFADPEIADLINRHYVAIKLDREEYPAIDAWLMEALQALGKQGGWPLTMFLDCNARPFWGGTYFPKDLFATLLRDIAALYQTKPEDIAQQSKLLHRHLSPALSPAQGKPSRNIRQARLEGSLSLIDWQQGGVLGQVKFPCLPLAEYLWLAGEAGHATSKKAAKQWADVLCCGGIFDPLGGGFFRYATEQDWRWPHFEKMLCDNGMALNWLAMRACGAGDNKDLYRRTALAVARWLLEEMALPEGGFASALDADQPEGEGAYYLWQKGEIEALLGREEASFFFRHFALHDGPEGEGGLPYLAAMPQNEAEAKNLESLCALLAQARIKRTPPARDEKLLSDANGLAIEGLARAGMLLGEPDLVKAGKTHWQKILPLLWRDKKLIHCAYHHDTDAQRPAIADDYAFMLSAALSLFEASGEESFLKEAQELAQAFQRDFWQEEAGGFLYASTQTIGNAPERCHARDAPTPSANGRMVANAAKLGALARDEATRAQWQETSEALLARFAPADDFAGAGLRGGQFWCDNLTTLAGDIKAMTGEEQQALRQNWFPGLLLTHQSNAGQKAGEFILCRGELCLAPARGARELAVRLNEARNLLDF